MEPYTRLDFDKELLEGNAPGKAVVGRQGCILKDLPLLGEVDVEGKDEKERGG